MYLAIHSQQNLAYGLCLLLLDADIQFNHHRINMLTTTGYWYPIQSPLTTCFVCECNDMCILVIVPLIRLILQLGLGLRQSSLHHTGGGLRGEGERNPRKSRQEVKCSLSAREVPTGWAPALNAATRCCSFLWQWLNSFSKASFLHPVRHIGEQQLGVLFCQMDHRKRKRGRFNCLLYPLAEWTKYSGLHGFCTHRNFWRSKNVVSWCFLHTPQNKMWNYLIFVCEMILRPFQTVTG